MASRTAQPVVRTPWARLKHNLAQAETFPLDILVWGPAPTESLEYRKRCEIRDALNAAGHNAAFSEDLMPAGEEVLDPLEEELLHADSAHLIVVLYEGRGVQSEVDTLLDKPRFAEKAVVLIHEEVYEKVKASVSKGTWSQLSRFATAVVQYTSEDLERCLVVQQANALAHQARRAAYIDTIRQAAERR